MKICEGIWTFKTIVSRTTDKETVCRCTYLKITNYSAASIYIGIGGGEIEIKVNESEIINNNGVEVTHELKLRFSPGTINVKIIKTELA